MAHGGLFLSCPPLSGVGAGMALRVDPPTTKWYVFNWASAGQGETGSSASMDRCDLDQDEKERRDSLEQGGRKVFVDLRRVRVSALRVVGRPKVTGPGRRRRSGQRRAASSEQRTAHTHLLLFSLSSPLFPLLSLLSSPQASPSSQPLLRPSPSSPSSTSSLAAASKSVAHRVSPRWRRCGMQGTRAARRRRPSICSCRVWRKSGALIIETLRPRRSSGAPN